MRAEGDWVVFCMRVAKRINKNCRLRMMKPGNDGGGDTQGCPKNSSVFISSLKMCNIALIDLLKGDAQAKNNIVTTSLTNMQERDVKDSHSGCFDCRYHIN